MQMPTKFDLEDYAEANGCNLVEAACVLNSPLISKQELWPEIVNAEDLGVEYSQVDLCNSQRGDLLTEMSKAAGVTYQFPKSTIFLHGLGSVASAMTKSFEFQYRGKGKPVNLYVVTSQPPSTGKSGINELFTDPISHHYKEINANNRKKRIALSAQIRSVQKEVDEIVGTEKGISTIDSNKIEELDELMAELESFPMWKWTITNTTIESAEEAAQDQDGMYNIISAEADSINTLLGLSYGDKINTKANMELVLKAWDSEHFSGSRISRDAYTGNPRSTISVIAQDSSIDSLLTVGQAGRGISERFLLLREKSMLGERDHKNYSPIDTRLTNRYDSLIKHILNETDVSLTFDEDCHDYIAAYRQGLEPDLADGGKYDNAMITGALGKADKQIMRIAAILHTIAHWQDLADRKYNISSDYVLWAIGIFDELSQTYIKAADSMGFAGKSAEVEVFKDYLSTQAQKGKLRMTIGQLRSNIKSRKALAGVRNLTLRINDVIMPELVRQNYCYMHGGNVFVNPRLR